MLCLHGTDNVVGHGVVVGLGGKPNRQYASELAERGYVTLGPNYPLLAKYQPDLEKLGWSSGTLKAVWDNQRGLDLLDSLPFVKRGSYAAIGHSLGGHNAVFTAVLDDRIQAVITNCGLDSFVDYYAGKEEEWLPGKGWTSTRYMPRLAEYRGRLAEIPFDFHELVGALASPCADHRPQARRQLSCRERRSCRRRRSRSVQVVRTRRSIASRASRLRSRFSARTAANWPINGSTLGRPSRCRKVAKSHVGYAPSRKCG